ncbi:MAG: hypothetical protein IPG20_14395, partial [Gammaproteobacteria bacterium]|nr:hypothetical protein [Gammaproteobacteria bacterium]
MLIWSLAVKQVAVALAVVLAVGFLWILLGDGRLLELTALCGVLVVDSARVIEMAFMNASRQQRSYAAWATAEAWGRPLFAVLLVIMFDAKPSIVLLGYFFSSLLNFVVFSSPNYASTPAKQGGGVHFGLIDTEIRNYCRPLMPLG